MSALLTRYIVLVVQIHANFNHTAITWSSCLCLFMILCTRIMIQSKAAWLDMMSIYHIMSSHGIRSGKQKLLRQNVKNAKNLANYGSEVVGSCVITALRALYLL